MYLSKFLFGDEAILVDIKESESDVGRVFPFPSLCCINLLEYNWNLLAEIWTQKQNQHAFIYCT